MSADPLTTPRPPLPAVGGLPVRRVLALAWPVLVQQFLILSVGLYDRYLAGAYPPDDPTQHVAYQAAQTSAHYLAWFISSYIVLVGVGATAVVARCVGGGDLPTANRALHQAVLLGAGLGLAGGAAGWVLVEPVVGLLGLTGDAARFAGDFLRPILALLVFQVVEGAAIACLDGAGDTRTGMWVRGTVLALNVPLAWGLFHGVGPFLPRLGFVGIAYGTAMSHAVGAALVLTVLARGRSGLRLEARQLRPELAMMLRMLRVSVPAAADSFSVIAGQAWFLAIVNRLGKEAAAAHGIAIGWESLSYSSGHAFAVAAMALVGQNLGARRPAEAARSGWTALLIGGGLMGLMGVTFFSLAGPMFRLMCPTPGQAPVVALGVPVLRLVAFSMPALSCAIIFTGALRGAGDTRVPVAFTWVGFLLVRIPLAYLLTSERVGLGLFGAWLAMGADLHVRGAFFLGRFASGRWKTARV